MKINPINNNNNISYKSKLKVTPELIAYLKNATPSQLKAYQEGCQNLLKDGKNKVYEYKTSIKTVSVSEYGKKYKARLGVILDENQEEYNSGYISTAYEINEINNDNEIKTNSSTVALLLDTLFEPEKNPLWLWELKHKVLRIKHPYTISDFKKNPFIPNL